MAKESVIEVLSDREHVLLRPQIYIGDTTSSLSKSWTIDCTTKKFVYKEVPFNEGFFKLFSEIIDNSIDEYVKTKGEYGNRIEVSVIDRNHIIVKDNGRGVPTTKHQQFKDKTSFEIAFTFLKAGSNFRKGTEKSESDTNIGMNGVGVSLVNILSNSFKVTTEDSIGRYELKCSDHMNNIDCSKVRRTGFTGTEVEAEIDMSLFDNSDIITKNDVKIWCYKRLVELHTFYPEIKFYFNKEEITKTIFDMIDERNLTVNDNKGNFVSLVFKNGLNEQSMSYVNSLNTYNGGTHLNYAEDKLYQSLLKKVNKKYKMDFKIDDISKRFYTIINVANFPNPKFSTQNKTKLITNKSEVKDYFTDSIFEKCSNNFFTKFESEIKSVAEEIENGKVQKAVKKEAKEAKRLNIAKHIEANTKNRQQAILFISEGLSAAQMFIRARNKNIHASYPLRGKILNVYNEKASNVAASQELKQLMQVIGLELGKKPNKLNYGKISILTDADPDGDDICSILLVFFYKYFPDLFKMGMIHRVYAPLVVATKGNKKKTYYTLEDYEKESEMLGKEGWKTSYYKGLGKMSEEEYREMLNNPVESTIRLGDAKKINETMEILFGKNTDNRKKWLQGEIKL